VIVAAIVVIVVLVAGGGDGKKSSGPEAVSAGCVAQSYPSMGRNHVLEVKPDFEYNSFPATSGPHSAQPAIWNLYTSPVPELDLVHNLEHGGVAVQFGKDVHPDDIRAVVAWYLLSPDGMVAAPLPELEDTIALTAWRHLLTCTGFDEQAITAFRDTYRFNGPEKLPPDTMQRGM